MSPTGAAPKPGPPVSVDPTLLQVTNDRLHGLPYNGYAAADFPPPLNDLWRRLDAAPSGATQQDRTTLLYTWVGNDPARLDLVDAMMNLTPGAPPPPDPWPIWTLKDAYQPRPPLEFIVADTMPAPSLAVTFGAPGCLKSMLLADLCVCVAGGLDWLPPLDPSRQDTTKRTAQAPVLWLDFDNGRRRTHERFEALARARGLADSIPLNYTSMPMPWLNLSDQQAVSELEWRIKKLGAKLVVIDNLGVVSGGVDENSAAMIPVMAALRSLSENTGAAIIVIHHQRKGNGGASSSTRAGESLRGHTSIEAALDLALLVERESQTGNIIVKSTKTRDVDVLPFGAAFDFAHKPGTKELATARFLGTVVDNPKSVNSIENGVLDVLRQHGEANQAVLIAEVQKLTHAGRDKIRDVISNMVVLGTLRVAPGKNNATLYRIA